MKTPFIAIAHFLSFVSVLLLISNFALAFELTSNARVVFYGDSITDLEAFLKRPLEGPYSSLVENFILLRYPDLKIEFNQVGVGGDRVGGGKLGSASIRFQRDIAPFKPTLVFFMLGMNDGEYRDYSSSISKKFSEGYGYLFSETLKLPNKPKILSISTPLVNELEPTFFEKISHHFKLYSGSPEVGQDLKFYNFALIQYFSELQAKFNNSKIEFLNLQNELLKIIREFQQSYPHLRDKLYIDKIHPDAPLHLWIAAELLKKLRVTPLVSDVEIDCIKGLVKAEGAQIRDWDLKSFWLLEGALPYPVHARNLPEEILIESYRLKSIFNKEILKIRNCPKGNYELKIDHHSVGTFSHDALSGGIELSNIETPMILQSKTLMQLNSEIIVLKYKHWRGGKIDTNHLNELIKKRDLLRKPQEHFFQIVKTL